MRFTDVYTYPKTEYISKGRPSLTILKGESFQMWYHLLDEASEFTFSPQSRGASSRVFPVKNVAFRKTQHAASSHGTDVETRSGLRMYVCIFHEHSESSFNKRGWRNISIIKRHSVSHYETLFTSQREQTSFLL